MEKCEVKKPWFAEENKKEKHPKEMRGPRLGRCEKKKP